MPLFLLFNTQTMHFKLFYTHQHCYDSLKPYTLAGFEPGSSCSWGGCDVHCATPPCMYIHMYFSSFWQRRTISLWKYDSGFLHMFCFRGYILKIETCCRADLFSKIIDDLLKITSFYMKAGLPVFSCYMIPKLERNVPNEHKMYQMNTKCTKWTQNVPNGHKISQMSEKYSKWP
jgi:hypothetical protein